MLCLIAACAPDGCHLNRAGFCHHLQRVRVPDYSGTHAEDHLGGVAPAAGA